MIETNNQEVINILPLMKNKDRLDKSSNPYVFQSLIIKESIFNEVPELILKVASDNDLTELGSEHNLSLKYSDGTELTIMGYVYDISYQDYNQTIKFMVCDSDFTKTPYTDKFSSINSAINTCYNGRVKNKPDSNIELNLYQKNETNFDFLTRILYGYGKDILFGYSMSGLVFLDLNNDKPGKTEYSLQSQFKVTENPDINNPANLDFDTKVIEKFSNHRKVKYRGLIYDVSKEYDEFLEATLYNQSRYNKNKGSLSASIRSLCPIELLDIVNFTSLNGIATNYYAVSKVMTIDREVSNTQYTFYSINPNNE